MFEVIYDPSIINSLIRIAYCETTTFFDKNNNLTNTNYFPIVLIRNKNNIFYLHFDQNKARWMFYHSDADLITPYNKNIIHILLLNKEYIKSFDKRSKYYGVIIGNNLEITHHVEPDNIGGPDLLSYAFDVKQNEICEKNYSVMSINTFPKNISDCKGNLILDDDILIASIEGFINLKSSSFVDLIFSVIMSGGTQYNSNTIAEILTASPYLEKLIPAFDHFKRKFQTIHGMNPKEAYVNIYKLYMNNDNKYFNKKMLIFQSEIMKTANDLESVIGSHQRTSCDDPGCPEVSIISDFIYCIKKDMSLEFLFIYQRLRNYPHERIALYKKYPYHPYIVLIKMIHQYFSSNKISYSFIGLESIYRFIENNNFKKISPILIQAIANRSEIFVFLYDLYMLSKYKNIKPIYKSHKNYFPFKIFSTKLFLAEHMLTKHC